MNNEIRLFTGRELLELGFLFLDNNHKTAFLTSINEEYVRRIGCKADTETVNEIREEMIAQLRQTRKTLLLGADFYTNK